MLKTRFSIAALAAMSLPALALATAASADSAQLRYNDLDLATEAGKTELARRVEATARKACKAETVTGSRIPNRGVQEQCIADAKRQIEEKIAARAGRNSYGR